MVLEGGASIQRQRILDLSLSDNLRSVKRIPLDKFKDFVFAK